MTGPVCAAASHVLDCAWLIGLDLAAAWDLADGRTHHPALVMFALRAMSLGR